MRDGAGGIGNHDVDLAGHQILHGRCHAAIRHELKPGIAKLLEQYPPDVPRAAGARGTRGCLMRVGLQPADKVAQILCGHGLLRSNEPRGNGRERNGFEIGDRIVGKRVNRGVDNLRGPGAVKERIAVAFRPGDPAHPDRPGSSCDVLDDNGLTESCAHAFG